MPVLVAGNPRYTIAQPILIPALRPLSSMTQTHSQSEPAIFRDRFDTRNIAPDQQLLTWREWVGYLVDTPLTREQITRGFNATVELYSVNDLTISRSRTDELKQERPLARISTDAVRCFVFHVVLEGAIGDVKGLYRKQEAAQSGPGILAIDMNQTFYAHRPGCHVLTLLAPRAMVESALPDAESIHGRIIQNRSPLFRLIYNHLIALDRDLPLLSAREADRALRVAIHLIVAAFGKQARLSGNARAAARAALYGQARRYIDAHLHHPELSPEILLHILQIPRPSLYRMFEHEGGLAAYIRNRRLRHAADDLIRFPHVAVMDVAYGLGFNSPQDFSRAFRRAFAMAPQDFREFTLQSRHELMK